MSENYYHTLGINRSSSQAEVQKSYRELAQKYHPDLNPDDEKAKQKFQEVQKAYEVLNDSKKRGLYDRYGSSFESVGAEGGPQGRTEWNARGGPGGFEDIDLGELFGQQVGSGGFADIFSQFTGGAQRRRRPRPQPQRGADLQSSLQIPFATSITGGEAQVSIRRAGGKIESISVKIPAGIEDGKKIRLRGQGEKSPSGGSPGDILITVHVGTHPHFRRRGKNLEISVPITLSEAVLGAKVDVPTPQGTIELTVPPGTSSGQKLRIKGLGVAISKTEKGDIYAEILIVLPPQIDAKSMELIKQMAKEESFNPRQELKW